MQNEINFIPFSKSFEKSFKDLNVAWLQKYFVVEPIDEEMLANPEAYIIDKGGYIFFAQYKGEVVGTFAFMKEDDASFELSKMAVDEHYQGLKIGNVMLQFAIEKAKELGAKKLFLFSNTRLEPAIHLYRKYGFIEQPLGSSEYQRANIKMERQLL